MSDRRLVCPHCGHDGNPETSKSPLESFGFNYLEEDVVSREIRGFDAEGKLLVERHPRAGGLQGSNPRIECRSCWQTFTLPAEVERALAPEDVPGTPPEETKEPAAEPRAAEVPMADASRRLAEKLADFLETALHDIRETLTADLRRIDGNMEQMSTELQGVRSELGAVRTHGEGLAEEQLRIKETAGGVEARLRSYEDGVPVVQEEIRSLAAGQSELRQMIGTQAKMVLAVEDGVSKLEQIFHQNRELMDQHASSANAELAALRDRCDAQERRAAEEAEKSQGLTEGLNELRAALDTISRRLDAQAGAIRSLHVMAEAQIRQKEELKVTLQKLEALAQAAETPSPLPDDL